jgi:plasmid maintenance system antidote protein VapI
MFIRNNGEGHRYAVLILQRKRPVTAELALLSGRAFDELPQNWLNLQTTYDLKLAETSLGKLVNDVHLLAHT